MNDGGMVCEEITERCVASFSGLSGVTEPPGQS